MKYFLKHISVHALNHYTPFVASDPTSAMEFVESVSDCDIIITMEEKRTITSASLEPLDIIEDYIEGKQACIECLRELNTV